MLALQQMCSLLLILSHLAVVVYGVRGVQSSCSSRLSNFNLSSSSFQDILHSPHEAQINGTSAWCAKQNDVTSPWIQVSFGTNVHVAGMRIQGSKTQYIWVERFRIEYMTRDRRWIRYTKVLKGNSYKNYMLGKTNTFHPALFAHDIRIYPLKVNGVTTGVEETFAPCLRMEFYGCHVSCPDPGQPKHGRRIGNDFLDGMTVNFTCNHPGYDLFGAGTVWCRNGTWNKPTPSCKARCTHPGILTNGFIVDLDVRHDSIIQYRCKRGFKLKGLANLTCNNGRWDNRLPSCITDDDDDDDDGSGSGGSQVLCSDPGNSTNGGRHGNNFIEGQTVKFFCQKGFTLFGFSQITCINGSWSGTVPRCRAQCKNPGIPLNGGRHGNNFAEGQRVMFFCHQGYDLIGVDEPMCVAGQWSPIDPPVCKPKGNTCTRPNSLPNARIYGRNKQFYSKGDLLFYMCTPGYVLLGKGVRTCRGNTWSKSLFRCSPKSCGDPGTPVNGYKNGLVYNVKSQVYYHCLPGHAMRGSSIRECLTNGSWSGVKPMCTAVDCGDLPTPTNGAKDVAKTTYLGRINFRCIRRGYRLIGSRSRVCQSNGNWSGTQPQCKKRLCDRINPPRNGAMSIHGGYTYRSKVTFTCDKNHVMEGSDRSVCLDDGTWSSPTPNCKKICLQGWIRHNDFCYLFKHKVRRPQSWKRLKTRCKKYKASLLYLDDNEEWSFVKRHLKTAVSSYAIGLTYKRGGIWTWTEGGVVMISKWDTSKRKGKNQTCGVVQGSNGLFRTVLCGKKLNAYICKKSG